MVWSEKAYHAEKKKSGRRQTGCARAPQPTHYLPLPLHTGQAEAYGPTRIGEDLFAAVDIDSDVRDERERAVVQCS